MQIDLSGKAAFVSGSTEGIGYAAARGLARAGADVWINGRTEEKVEAAREALSGEVPDARVRGIAADLGTPEGCDFAISSLGDVDILINNVGIFDTMDFFETDDETWQNYFDINVMSSVRLSRALVPAMEAAGWGRVIFISSESGVNIPPPMIPYGFTKTAMLSISRGLAKRMSGTGVTVNAVLPGPTTSEGFSEMIERQAAESGRDFDTVAAEFVQENRPTSIIGRPATVDEVANMIVYACSPQASATAGAALRVEGGIVDTPI